MSFKVSKWTLILTMGVLGLTFSGCATPIAVPPSPIKSLPPAPELAEEPPAPPPQPGPRALASFRLTDQGRMLLEQGQTDDGISVLERAMSLNPTNGENYYYMAEAWLVKGNTSQAEEFNGLAHIYLKKDVWWMGKVMGQKRRIKAHSKRAWEIGQGALFDIHIQSAQGKGVSAD